MNNTNHHGVSYLRACGLVTGAKTVQDQTLVLVVKLFEYAEMLTFRKKKLFLIRFKQHITHTHTHTHTQQFSAISTTTMETTHLIKMLTTTYRNTKNLPLKGRYATYHTTWPCMWKHHDFSKRLHSPIGLHAVTSQNARSCRCKQWGSPKR
jgi:hypothetical protein